MYSSSSSQGGFSGKRMTFTCMWLSLILTIFFGLLLGLWRYPVLDVS